jgi:NADH-quinone oxidoreductase subunit M
MILIVLIVLPLAAGVLAWLSAKASERACRWISLAGIAADFAVALAIWIGQFGTETVPPGQSWLMQFDVSWIKQLGIHFHLGLDGLSLILILLTAFLGMMSVGISWTEIQDGVGFFHFNLLWVLAGIIGVFLALDLFLFYFFWELMLVPMYFLIAIWGHERRIFAAVKFFLFTQFSGLLMFVAILGLYFVHGRSTGVLTFDALQLRGTNIPATTALWLMLGFFIAFAVKLPTVPVHTWLPDAHTEAPTAGSVVLAGLLLKTGAYGLLRFVMPLFPEAAARFGLVAEVLAVIGILYGAALAFAQTDVKRLIAYTSVSHMGFVLLGVFVGNELAYQGVVMQIVCHGVATGALFMLVGALQDRIGTREMERMGGLWTRVPRMGGTAMFFAMASLGLPGLGNFVGEFLVLLGAYQTRPVLAIFAALGFVASVIYALWMMQRVFHGAPREKHVLSDLDGREMLMMTVMIVVLVWLGIYPREVFRTARPSFNAEMTRVAR